MDRQSAILVIAWSYQVSRHRFMYTDVDKECLSTFEERLFEYSKRTGVAGYHQWGLDAGPHQDGWNPYHNLPYEWNHEDREDESGLELQVRLLHYPLVPYQCH
jgi:hypothetical protein